MVGNPCLMCCDVTFRRGVGVERSRWFVASEITQCVEKRFEKYFLSLNV